MSPQPNVLLVDDRPDNLLALEAQLRGLDAELLKAGSGLQALDILLEHDIAVALVDVQMPEMDGFELAELMRGSPRTRSIPILFVTAGLHDRSRVFKGYEAGAVDFLIKPIEPRVLVNKIGVFLQLHQQRVALAERVQQLETAQRALQESDRRFRDLFSSMTEGFAVHELICDSEGRPIDFRFLEINPAFERLTGLRRDIVGRTHNEILPNDDPKWVQIYGKVALTGEPVQFEEYSPALKRWNEVFAFSPARGRFATLFSDITERKRSEEAVRNSERLLRDVIDGSPDLLVFLKDREGRFIATNSQVERILGKSSQDEIVGKTDYDFFPKDVAEYYRTHDRQVLESGRPTVIEEEADALGGRRAFLAAKFPLRDSSGTIYGVGAVSHDITDRKKLERALRDSEARFRQLAEALPQMVFEVSADGSEGYFNGRWIEFTGQPPGDVENTLEFVHPDDRERARTTWAHAVQTGTAYECEYRFRRRDGQHHWVLSRALPFKDENGNVKRWFGTATNVQDLKSAQEALHEADRCKTEFLAVLSHELRNPLTPIKNSLYILDRAPPGGDQARRAKGTIDRQVDQLVRLVDDLLDVTRITRNKIQLQRQRFELSELVTRTAEDHRSEFEQAGVRLEVVPAEKPVWVNADWNRLAQTVGNLLQNAAKFTPKEGRVTASVLADESRQQAVVRVVDTGVGMKPETLARLFRPFMQAETTLDRSKGGLGLGLSLVKGLVELHGGSVEARSAGLGRGTEFTLRLPLEPTAPAGEQPATAPPSVPRQRVLIIEDNTDAADSLREVLEFEEYEVAVAYDGPTGIVKAREFQPTVILCDIGLPGMNGYQVARALRAEPTLEGVHLIALTGYALPEDIQRAQDAGFHGHMAKPPNIEQINAALGGIQRCLTESHTRGLVCATNWPCAQRDG